MNLSEVVVSAQQALSGNKLRTGLTMLGMVIGISAVILISSIGQGAVAFITAELSVFGTNYFRVAPGQDPFSQVASTANPLTTEDAQAVRDANLSNVNLVAAVSLATGVVTGNQEKVRAGVRGVSPEVKTILQPELIDGEFFTEDDNQRQNKVALLGVDLSEELFGVGGNPVGESIRIDNVRYRVIGVVKASSAVTSNIFDDAAVIPIDSLVSQITGVDELFHFVVSIKNEDLLNQTMTDVEALLREHRDIEPGEDADFYTQSFKETLETIRTVTGLLTTMISGISGISLVVGGVGIMNIMLVTVTERTKEIGLLKAIGAKQQDILIQFLVESVTLSVSGGIIGMALGIMGAFLISQAASIPFVVSPISVAFAIGVSTLVGVVFGLYPAKKAASLNPIDALRYE